MLTYKVEFLKRLHISLPNTNRATEGGGAKSLGFGLDHDDSLDGFTKDLKLMHLCGEIGFCSG